MEENRAFLRSDHWQEWDDLETDQRNEVPPQPLQKPCPDVTVLVDLVPYQELPVGGMPLIEAIGGRKSRRELSSDAAKEMVRVREARRLYRRFHAECFWSFDPEYTIGKDDIAWVAEQLQKNGGRVAWEKAAKLCR